jgi:RHS repeat-associated protein
MSDDVYTDNHDPTGNRLQSTEDSGQSSVTNTYTSNALNQYTSVSFVPSVVYPVHDLDGNMTYDGSTWHHTYDAENRLIGSSPNTVTNGSVMLEYAYNYKNLRVEKIKKQLSGRDPGYPMNPQADPGTWDAVETRRYIWDGFNIAAEIIIDHVTPATNINYYTWGMDLSGSLQGAGGVGGLLCDTKVTSSATNTYYALGDANGNVTEYVDANGAVQAHGEHNAFGETELSGSMKDDFMHWFSTKPLDKTTGLISYELRYLKPDFAFLSRDPIGIMGGLNDYGFVNNDAVNRWDKLGLSWTEVLTWFGGWVSGSGKSFRALGPTSNAANDMKNTHHVNKARKLFREKNKDVKCCKDLKDYINYKADFRLPGLFASGANSTRQFIGSYRIDIYLFGCVNHKCKIDFELHNTTSATSFFYGLFPSWEREEFRMMGNVRQTIWWTEVYDAECP